jgi:hypothetical protein
MRGRVLLRQGAGGTQKVEVPGGLMPPQAADPLPSKRRKLLGG